ncbi:hypothetical protein TcWFU_002511 [Taenia crassiceps]|uniref:Uncharacterized protein n=1 Tax=Taenia crassiceps TaxID=6207 RepID=A0ABR4Q423_9CEST
MRYRCGIRSESASQWLAGSAGNAPGPTHTCHLYAPCGFSRVHIILLINLLGLINAGLIYLATVLVYRQIVHKNRRLQVDVVPNSSALTSFHMSSCLLIKSRLQRGAQVESLCRACEKGGLLS